MRVLLTRPLEDAEPLARRLQAGGVTSLMEPLLDIEFLDVGDIELSDVQGLLVTSANGVRAYAACSSRRDLAVWAVGDGSARAARDAGFQTVHSAGGDVKDLAELVCDQVDRHSGALLHIAGTKRAGDLGGALEAAGFQYKRVVLYEARKSGGLSDQICTALRTGGLDGVLLYSPRTAATFVDLIQQQGLHDYLKSVTVFCLSKAVANEAEVLAWKRISIAPIPQEDALIEDVFRALRET